MKRSELITKVSKNTNCDIAVVDAVFTEIINEIICALRKNEPASIHGFGKFVARSYGARKCYNPITGNIQMLEPSVQPAFIPGPKFRKEINNKNLIP